MSEKKPSRQKKAPPSKPASKSAGGSSNPMDLSLLEKMVQLMSQHDLTTVDVSDGDKRIVLKRGAEYAVNAAPVAVSAPVAPPAAAAPASAVPAAPVPATPATDPDAGLVAIKSPMVGTFYAAPSPDAKPFVSVGTSVDDESDVCVIEAMKVFNTIKAETRGTIARVNVVNGQTVEFGQVLFLVKP